MADLSIDLPIVLTFSDQEWQFQITTVKAHKGGSTGRFTSLVLTSSGQEWQFHIATVEAHVVRPTGRSTPQY